jgi:DNA repair protein RadD
VQVQMLGEGFDHPPLGVAAVFRPFRSLSPYVQFVGRIMRVMLQDDPNNPANHGYVISHVGLNNDANWRDFREFDLEDQQVFREWLESKTGPALSESGTESEGGKPRRFDQDMLVHGELLSDFVRQSFLDPTDERVIDRILDAVVPGVGVAFRTFMSREQAKSMLKTAQEKMLEATPEPIPVSPQRRRQSGRKRLADRPKSVAARVVQDLGLAPGGFEVSRLVRIGPGSPNLIAVLRLIHKAINKRLGLENDERKKPSASQVEAEMEHIDQIGDDVRDHIKTLRRASE